MSVSDNCVGMTYIKTVLGDGWLGFSKSEEPKLEQGINNERVLSQHCICTIHVHATYSTQSWMGTGQVITHSHIALFHVGFHSCQF